MTVLGHAEGKCDLKLIRAWRSVYKFGQEGSKLFEHGIVHKNKVTVTLTFDFNMVFQYSRQQNPKSLEDLYYQEDNFIEEGNCKVMRSFNDEVRLPLIKGKTKNNTS